MAAVDLARARRLLETLDDDGGSGPRATSAQVAFGLGAMAGELAKLDSIRARALLNEAFDRLREIAGGDRPGHGQASVANLMAQLLPCVERIDPDRVAERTWLAAACRGPEFQEPGPNEREATFALAMLVARYDRAMADVIVAADLERLPDALAESAVTFNRVTPASLKMLTAYDPRVIPSLLRALPDAARKPPARHDDSTAASMESRVRLAAGQILGFPNAARPIEASRVWEMASPYCLGE